MQEEKNCNGGGILLQYLTYLLNLRPLLEEGEASEGTPNTAKTMNGSRISPVGFKNSSRIWQRSEKIRQVLLEAWFRFSSHQIFSSPLSGERREKTIMLEAEPCPSRGAMVIFLVLSYL